MGDSVTLKLDYYVREQRQGGSPNLLANAIFLCAGSMGSVHTHPHFQNTYVRSGRFRFTVDGEPVEVGPGDTLAFPSNIPHGTLCLEAGALLDIFTPMREDFL